ncbi:MAG: hypothetical protein SPK50_01045 [Mobiluncus porci]|nr:hypothetical protein [Mobiluncus porci]
MRFSLKLLVWLLSTAKRRARSNKTFNVVCALRVLRYVGAIGGMGLIVIGIDGMHLGTWRPPTSLTSILKNKSS